MADSPEWYQRAAEAAAVFLAGLFGVRHGRKANVGTSFGLERRLHAVEAKVDEMDGAIWEIKTRMVVMDERWRMVDEALGRIEGKLDGRVVERRARPREDQ